MNSIAIEAKIRQIIDISWESFKNKVASGLFEPENEKMMQLQFAQTLQTLIPIFEYSQGETLKILLEIPVTIRRMPGKRIIDIVIVYKNADLKQFFPIELKCFRKYTREDTGRKRGAQNLGMFDYWADIENIEQYSRLREYSFGTQLTLTDDLYYVNGKHQGDQVLVYSTNTKRDNVTGVLNQAIAHRCGNVELIGKYSMAAWQQIGNYYFIRQENKLQQQK